LRLSRYPLRVVAPKTVQWTAFEKDGSPDAGAIVDSKALDVKDRTCMMRHHATLR